MASSVASAEAGFSLVELAIALAVLGVMLTGLLGPLQQLRTHQRQQDTRAALAAIRQGLLGYAMSHGRLPCPADPALADSHAQAGLALPDTGMPCQRQAGVLPWKTLGAPLLPRSRPAVTIFNCSPLLALAPGSACPSASQPP